MATDEIAKQQERDTCWMLDMLLSQSMDELKRQYEKWGHQDHTVGDWWLIVSEEVGELAKAALEGGDRDRIMAEAADVIACIARFVEKACRGEPQQLASSGWTDRP